MDKMNGGASQWRVCYQRGLPRLVLKFYRKNQNFQARILQFYFTCCIKNLGIHHFKQFALKGPCKIKKFSKCAQCEFIAKFNFN